MIDKMFTTIATETSNQLEEQGWAHVQTDIDPQNRKAVRNLFAIMNRALSLDPASRPEVSVIAPRDNSCVLATTHDAMSFHTDNVYLDNPCKTIALFCAIQADEGGENELVDALATAKDMLPAELEEFTKPQWRWMNPMTDSMSSEYNIIDDSFENIRWWRMGASPRNIGALAVADAFEGALKNSRDKAEIRMQPGDLLITDNTRIVHNRNAFSGRRHIYRARFW